MFKKIKTLEFEVSNWTIRTDRYGNNIDKAQYDKDKARLATPEKIDETVNEFCKDKNVIDIKPMTYTKKRHNNGGYDWVMLVYTIIYEE